MYHILMIAPTPFFADRGCHIRIYEQARSLQKLGNRVTICTYHNGRDIAGLDIHRIINIPWYNKLEAGASYHKFYLDFILLLKSLYIAKRIRPDIVHGHLHEGAAVGYVVSRVFRIPLLFDYQGSLTAELRNHNFIKGRGFYFEILYKAEKIIDNLADVVVASSTDMIKQLREEFKVKDVYKALDGVDPKDFRKNIDTKEVRKKLKIPINNRIVVYLGILSKYQGVDCLLESIFEVLQKVKSVHFLIMGYPNVDRYKNMAEKLGIANNVTFTGRIDYKNAPEYLNLGDIAVGPKLAETEADGKIYNYMACALPIVASDTPAHREILADTAIFTEANNAVSLAQGIVKLLTDRKLAEDLAMRSHQRAVEKFSWDNLAKRLLEYYKICIGNFSKR